MQPLWQFLLVSGNLEICIDIVLYWYLYRYCGVETQFRNFFDGGSLFFADTIRAVKELNEKCNVEVLVPDFKGLRSAIDNILFAAPEVFNHNLETVPRLYPSVRPGARYFHSLNLLLKVKMSDPNIFTKQSFSRLNKADGSEFFKNSKQHPA